MDQKSQEKLGLGSQVPESKAFPEQTEKIHQNKEIGKKTAEVLQAGESAELQLGMEFSEGKVSEVSTEDKAFAPAGGSAKSYSADEIEAIRAKLLAALPPQEIMIKQIRRKLYQEEKNLTKRLKKYRKNAHREAFQLTIVVAQLRKLREYFSMLAHATFEIVKHLWLKIVHGV